MTKNHMMTTFSTPRRRALLFLLPSLLTVACATRDEDHPWPATIVSIDELRPLTRMSVRMHRLPGDPPQGTVVLRLHVDENGAVPRASVFKSSGDERLDRATAHGAEAARFVPYRLAGRAVAVTVMAPMRFD